MDFHVIFQFNKGFSFSTLDKTLFLSFKYLYIFLDLSYIFAYPHCILTMYFFILTMFVDKSMVCTQVFLASSHF